MSDDAVVADHDVLIVGGGGAGLRAAIAIAETEPGLDLAVVSKVYPMRSHTVSAEGGAAAAIAEGDTLDEHAYDTVSGSDWLATRTRSRPSCRRRRASCCSSSTGDARGVGNQTAGWRCAPSAA